MAAWNVMAPAPAIQNALVAIAVVVHQVESASAAAGGETETQWSLYRHH